MNSSQFKSILFPAVLMSSTVFSVLTLPLVLFEPESTVVSAEVIQTDLPAFSPLQPLFDIFESGNKTLAIRYIGFSVVASASAGIATAELLRQASRRAEQANLQPVFVLSDQTPVDAEPSFSAVPTYQTALTYPTVPTYQSVGSPASIDRLDLVEWRQPIEAAPSEVNDAAELESLNLEGVDPAEALDHAANLETWNGSVVSLESSSEYAAEGQLDNSHEHFGDDPVKHRDIAAIAPGAKSLAVTLLTDPTTYQTCRIQLPNLEKRLFAVGFQGCYYRLVRAGQSQDQALAIAERLSEQGHEVLVTVNPTAYQDADAAQSWIVWSLAPEAVPCAA